MNFIDNEELRNEIAFNEGLIYVRELWYEIAEAKKVIPQQNPKLSLFQKELQKDVPDGWTVRVMLYGDIELQYKDNSLNKTYIIYKNKFGKEMFEEC